MEIDRRLFLFAAAATPLYAAAPLVSLSADEASLLEALCDQIVPADDAPGAKQAGVLYYIDRQLAGPLGRFAPNYRQGLAQFASACRERAGREFPSLPFAQQTAFLKDVESGSVPGLDVFFRMVADHAMQGFYGSPAHGGNRDEASWKMLGVAGVMEDHRH
ncbi:MAG: gluconate 2-dehydrogenase subunit 3 family protein [Bryobacteraceae bacterium]|jgi:gluconate 2-dehydrogenase gamma chain